MGWNDDFTGNLPTLELIRDAHGHVVGEIIPTCYGADIRDSTGNTTGWYDAASNITRDSRSNSVGEGNWLVATLRRR